jgi:hypothetical protein
MRPALNENRLRASTIIYARRTSRSDKSLSFPVLPNLQSVQYGTQSKVNQLEEFLGPGRKQREGGGLNENNSDGFANRTSPTGAVSFGRVLFCAL